ncbi:TIM barrel protein [Microlunatus lacustris]
MPDVALPPTATSTTTKALHTWSLFRTLGRYVAPGSMPSGGLPESTGAAPALLELPAELARHGYRSAQLCHFYLPRRDQPFLAELRAAFAEAEVVLECLLVDDGDLAHPTEGDAQRDWVSSWLEAAEALGAERARVVAGQQPPAPSTLAASATRLRQLADRHPDVRLVTENWHALLPDAATVVQLLDQAEGQVGFLVDLGNWKGPDRHTQLAAVAGLAETCQAKVRTDPDGRLDLDEYRTCLTGLAEGGYTGPLALVHDGPDPDEWGRLEDAYAVVRSVFGSPSAG